MDYTSTPIDTTFTAGSTNATINIPVTMDALAEESEIFNLRFTIDYARVTHVLRHL